MLLPLLLSTAAAAQDTWVPRTLPSLCHTTPAAEAPLELLDADHLPFPRELPARGPGSQAPVPSTLLLQLVDEHLRATNHRAQLELAGGSLLVQAEPAGRAAVDTVLADLEAAGAFLRIPWQAELHLGDGAPLAWSGVARPGERFALGERRAVGYLGAQDVNVASDSGVAEPETHHALLGATLHLTLSNLSDGSRLIEGCLDLAELVELETFDPDTPDLGLLQLPEVTTAQVRFAGLDQATVQLTGLPDPLGDATLVVRVARRAAEVAYSAWRVHDVHALTRRPPQGAPIAAGGFGIDARGGAPRSEALPSHDAAALAALLGGSFEEGAPLWSDGLLFVRPRSSAATAASALLPALEAHLVAGSLQVRAGELSATVDVVGGREARLVVGTERRRATEVDSQLAPSSWMPILEVERTFDGLVLGGQPLAGTFRGAVRVTGGRLLGRVPEPESGLAALQRLERTRRGSSVELLATAESEQVILSESRTGSAVHARLLRR